MSSKENLEGNYNEGNVIQLSAYTTPIVEVDTRNEWVTYGYDNNHFNELISYYKGSTTSASVINGLSGLIYGGGLKATDASKKPDEYAKFRSILKAKDCKKIIFDRKMLGMAAMQVVYKGNKLKSIKHFPMETLRCGKANDLGEITHYYYSNDWDNVRNISDVKRIDAYGFGNKKNPEIYILKPYVTGEFYYTQPDYAAALPYCKLEEEIGDYLVNEVMNGFSGSMLINFNNGIPKKNQQQLLSNKIKNKFTGSKGDKIVINYNKNKEDATTIERLPLDNAPEHYKYLSEECRDKIIVGHRITSPLLLGIREGNNGFSSNADEIETATMLMDKVVVGVFQDEFIDGINEILNDHDIALDLYFEKITPRDFAGEEEIKERDEQEDNSDKKLDELKEKLSAFLLASPIDNNTKTGI